MIIPYLFEVPIFHCKNSDGTVKVCYEDSGACVDQIISPDSVESISLDYKLYCDRRDLRDLGESLIFLGCSVGIFVFNSLADNIGRKVTIALAWGFSTICMILFVSIDNYYGIVVSTFGIGMGLLPSLILTMVYMNEISIGKFRQRSSIYRKFLFLRQIQTIYLYLYTCWSLSEVFILPLTEISSYWRTFAISSLLIPMIVLNFIPFFLEETPKYLYTKDRIKCV